MNDAKPEPTEITELFSTTRLSVRRLVETDAEAMLAIYGDAEAMRFVGDGRPLDLAACRYWIEVTDRNIERRGYGMLAAVDRANGELIGCVGIVHPGQQDEPELKYALRRDHWSRGLATELAAGAVAFAQDKLGLRRLIATVYAEHTKSQAVLQKTGFRLERTIVNEDGSHTQVWVLATARHQEMEDA
ncbi:MAG TPA: GNAT family N-acetyltransferase [Fimbriimonadaceae bacterium]|nr:GNAT family N-acetyltransferase [Fimbriimonadaceae bacterium]